MLDGYYAKADNYIPSVSVNPDNQCHEVNIKDIYENHLTKVENYMKKVIQNDVRLSIKYINGKDYPNTRYQNFDLLRIVSFDDLDSQSCGTLYINYTKKGILWFLIKKKTSKGTKIYFSYGEAIGLKLKKDNVVINALNKTLIRSE